VSPYLDLIPVGDNNLVMHLAVVGMQMTSQTGKREKEETSMIEKKKKKNMSGELYYNVIERSLEAGNVVKIRT
jgi:hypothetical protein